jgi:hypothetical protein
MGHVGALGVTAELCQEILFFPSDDLALFRNGAQPGKTPFISCQCTPLRSEPQLHLSASKHSSVLL